MPKITVTFEEEGNVDGKVVVELPEPIGTILDRYIQDNLIYHPDTGTQIRKYSSKSELFLKHFQSTLIEPLVEQYSKSSFSDLSNKLIQFEREKQIIQSQIKELVTPKIIVD